MMGLEKAVTTARPLLGLRLLSLLTALLVFAACSSPEDVADEARTAALAAAASRDWSAAADALAEFRAARPITPRTLTEVARLMADMGEPRDAIWLLEDAIGRSPTSDSLRLELAHAALLIGQPGRAVMILDAITDDSPAAAETLVLRARGWLELGDASETHSALNRAEAALAQESDPTLESQLDTVRLGFAALEGDGDAGHLELRALTESDKGNATAWRALTRELRRTDQAEEARSLLKAAIAAQPDRIDLDSSLIETHFALGDHKAAERVLRERIERHSTPGRHLALAKLLASLGNQRAAVARYKLATSEFPKSEMLHSGVTELALDMEKTRRSKSSFDRYTAISKQGVHTEFLQARIELATDKPDQALYRLTEVSKKLVSPSTHFWLGRALEATEDFAGAASHYAIVFRMNPKNASVAVSTARLARRRGNWRAVVRAARVAVESGPQDPLGWRYLAEALAELNEWAEAEEVGWRRLERFPNKVDSHVRLAEALHRQQRLDASLAVLDDAGNVGISKRKRGKQDSRAEKEAVAKFGAAISQAPEIVAERVMLFAAQGNGAEGLELSGAILNSGTASARLSDDQKVRLLTAQARLLLWMGREPAGLSSLRFALMLDTEDLRPLALRAAYYSATRRLDLGRLDCQNYLNQRPDDPRVTRFHGMLLAAEGKSEQAAEAYRRAIQLDDEDWVSGNNLALMLVTLGEFEEAFATATHAAALATDNASVQDTLGYVALKAGRAEFAVEVLERVVKTKPDLLEALVHLAEAYGTTGRTDEARQLLAHVQLRANGNRQLLEKVAEVKARIP